VLLWGLDFYNSTMVEMVIGNKHDIAIGNCHGGRLIYSRHGYFIENAHYSFLFYKEQKFALTFQSTHERGLGVIGGG